jgi:hypothetical protein
VKALLLLAAAVLTGCSSDPAGPPLSQDGVSVVESPRPCEPEPATSDPVPEGFPRQLALPPGTVVTGVGSAADQVQVTGRAAGDAGDLLEHFRTAAGPAGLAVIRDEDEGRSGRLQLFGATSEVSVTVARLGCPAGSARFTVAVRRTVP